MVVEETAPPAAAAIAASSAHDVTVVIEGIGGGVRWTSREEFWAYREVLWAFALRRVKARYKQTFFGFAWAIVQPIVSAVLFAIFIGRVARVGSEGLPYFIFALSGMVIWSWASSVIAGGVAALVGESGLLRKVYFPREFLPLSVSLSSVIDLLPGIAVFLVAGMIAGYEPRLTWVALPISLVIAGLAASGIAVGLSALNLYYRDVGYVLPFALQLGLFATPVVYSLNQIHGTARTVYAIVNPFAAAVDGARRTVLHGQWPQWGLTAGAFGVSVLLCIVGYAVFKRLERGFSDKV